MNYKQKHQEDLEAAKGWLAIAKENDNKIAIQILENLFPELRESDDEKIRKELIEFIRTLPCTIHVKEEYFHWLEKQGEQNKQHLYDIIEALWNLLDKIDTFSDLQIDDTDPDNPFRKIEDITQERHKFVKSDGYSLFIENFMITNDKNFEKQGEQNSTDNVEPKFKVGDWITNGEHTWKVTDIKPLDYILQSPNGNTVDDTISHVDEHFHLWTIQDAKDGDVLANKYGAIFINAGSNGGVMLDCYCYLSVQNKFYIEEHKTGSWFYKNNIKLATKEQRDLLFQKMKEAGYEWDAEKKELKKIEPSCYHNDGLYYAIDILEKTFGKVEGYQSDDGKMEHQTAIETVNALYHKKPAWNEKYIADVFEKVGLARIVREQGNDQLTNAVQSAMIELSKHQTSSWSEEDEHCIELLLPIIDSSSLIPKNRKKCKEFLKSLKDRVQPRPKQEWCEDD